MRSIALSAPATNEGLTTVMTRPESHASAAGIICLARRLHISVTGLADRSQLQGTGAEIHVVSVLDQTGQTQAGTFNLSTRATITLDDAHDD
jgi:hypothetical protein